MDELTLGRRERRRRKMEMKMEGNRQIENGFQKTVENFEFSSPRKLARRDTYTVLHKKNEFEVGKVDDVEKEFSGKGSENSGNDSAESKNLTYSLDNDSDSLKHCTYNVDNPTGIELNPPVPAPRKRKSINLEPEKVSSDTDRDITEIDLDDLRLKSPKSDLSSKLSPVHDKSPGSENDLVVPVPKPRKSVRKNYKKTDSDSQKSKSESSPVKSQTSKENLYEKSTREDENLKICEEPPGRPEDPLVENLHEEAKMAETKQKSKRQRKSIGDLLDRKKRKKKSKTFSSLMKLEKSKIPRISFILKDLKEEESKNKSEIEEDKTEIQIDSPHYGESVQNGRIYVQGKNGFHVKERNDVLRSGKQNAETEENGGMMEDSTVNTAILLQKYWSRSMTYFHGVLAGFGFSHAATVTAIMLHYNYDPQGFISVYSCLSLKIHYVFYALTAFCIVSCFDRIDIGHMNRRHWSTAWKSPSMWIVLTLYVISFGLTFAHQISEARFDAYPGGNETEIWNGQSQNQIQVGIFQWYHAVWARDTLVLLAWLVISLTDFEDYLHSHINNMAKYAEVEEGRGPRHKIDYF